MMILYNAFRVLCTYAPIFVIVNNYIENMVVAFIVTIVAGIVYQFLSNIPYISIITVLVTWIWGFVIMLKYYPLVFTIIYGILFLINIYMWIVGVLLIKYRSGQLRSPVNTDDQETDESE